MKLTLKHEQMGGNTVKYETGTIIHPMTKPSQIMLLINDTADCI